MAPLPKRKHSTARKGRRMSERTIAFKNLVSCKNCQKPKLPHKTCKHCRR